MKRSVSRASKVSADAQEPIENFFPGIPDSKWHEFLEKEDTDSFILGIREEILGKCTEQCFENYLEKQAVAFTVQCAYLAWCKVLNMYYMFRDPVEVDDPKGKESWEPDPEPEPSIVDTWGSKCMTTIYSRKGGKTKDIGSDKVVCKAPLNQVCSGDSIESCSFVSDLFDLEEGGFLYPFAFTLSADSGLSQKKSIFTRTLSMSRESLPLNNPFGSEKNLCVDSNSKAQSVKKKKPSSSERKKSSF